MILTGLAIIVIGVCLFLWVNRETVAREGGFRDMRTGEKVESIMSGVVAGVGLVILLWGVHWFLGVLSLGAGALGVIYVLRR